MKHGKRIFNNFFIVSTDTQAHLIIGANGDRVGLLFSPVTLTGSNIRWSLGSATETVLVTTIQAAPFLLRREDFGDGITGDLYYQCSVSGALVCVTEILELK